MLLPAVKFHDEMNKWKMNAFIDGYKFCSVNMGLGYSRSLTSVYTLLETKVQKGIRTVNGFS